MHAYISINMYTVMFVSLRRPHFHSTLIAEMVPLISQALYFCIEEG